MLAEETAEPVPGDEGSMLASTRRHLRVDHHMEEKHAVLLGQALDDVVEEVLPLDVGVVDDDERSLVVEGFVESVSHHCL